MTRRRWSLLAKRAIKSQQLAPPQLRLLTQSPKQKLADVDGYYFDDTARRDIRIYLIDSGLDPKHKVCTFRLVPRSSVPTPWFFGVEADFNNAGIRLYRGRVVFHGSFRANGQIG